MGAAASISNTDDLTTEEIKSYIVSLGEDYKTCADSWSLDGKSLSILSTEQKLEKLKEFGLDNNDHQNTLIAMFDKLKVSDNKNFAFVFVKPHANTPETRSLVEETFRTNGVNIIADGEIKAEDIDKDFLIDQHYYAIGNHFFYLILLMLVTAFILCIYSFKSHFT